MAWQKIAPAAGPGNRGLSWNVADVQKLDSILLNSVELVNHFPSFSTLDDIPILADYLSFSAFSTKQFVSWIAIYAESRDPSSSRTLLFVRANYPLPAHLSLIYGSFLAGATMRNSRGAIFARGLH